MGYTGMQGSAVSDGASGSNRALFAAGSCSISAMSAAVVTQPMDVLKTRMQAHQLVHSTKEGFVLRKPARAFATLSSVYKIAGFRGLWTGCLARVVGAGA